MVDHGLVTLHADVDGRDDVWGAVLLGNAAIIEGNSDVRVTRLRCGGQNLVVGTQHLDELVVIGARVFWRRPRDLGIELAIVVADELDLARVR